VEKIEDKVQKELQAVQEALKQNPVRKEVEGVDLKTLQRRKLVSLVYI
jgi:hypothetical protein